MYHIKSLKNNLEKQLSAVVKTDIGNNVIVCLGVKFSVSPPFVRATYKKY